MAARDGSSAGSSDRNTSASCQEDGPYAPANVKLFSGGRQSVNVNIHNILGSVTVGNKNTITYHHTGGSQRNDRNYYVHGQESDSDTDSSSSSDSEAERFFREKGMKKPSRKVFRDVKKSARNMNRMSEGIETLVIDPTTAGPRAYKYGQQVPFPPPHTTTTTTSRTTRYTAADEPHITTATFEAKPNPQRAQQPSAPKLTIYEKQTQTLNKLMEGISRPKRIIDETVIRIMVPQFGADWRRVFRHLDMHDAMIDMMYQECGEQQDTVYKLLVKWSQRCDTPYLCTLLEAMVRADQLQLAKSLVQACVSNPS